MKKGSVSLNNLGSFPSPGAPNYRDNGVAAQKGWSSERIPHPANAGGGSRRHISFAASTPFFSGRTLPSKWEDAERWICSPFSGYGVGKNPNYQLQRRPKSKSGPIVPPGIAFYSSCSPAMQVLDGGRSVRSPFSTGVLMADGISVLYGGSGGGGSRWQSCSGQTERNVGRSDGVPRCSDLGSEFSLPSSGDEKPMEKKVPESTISIGVSQRDVATQMSPEDSSCHSSPREGPSLCPSPLSILPVAESDDHSCNLEIREVQVDKRATTTDRFKRPGSRSKKKALHEVENFYQNSTAAPTSLVIAETATEISNLEREEAKITAWENLQRAKAEAAIRKLEMKLEKKRSASMDKILNKLRMAEMKAQELRSTISIKQDRQISRVPHNKRIALLFRKNSSVGYLSGCFTCYAR